MLFNRGNNICNFYAWKIVSCLWAFNQILGLDNIAPKPCADSAFSIVKGVIAKDYNLIGLKVESLHQIYKVSRVGLAE